MILLVNDDGIHARGLRELYRALRTHCDQPVLAVAPLEGRSGSGHAITLDRGLSIKPLQDDDFFGFAIDGTPCDCVKIGLKVLTQVRPSLVVAGINEGPNVGRSLFYSGTVGAALEAAIEGLPALAVSKALEGGDYAEMADYAAALCAGLQRGPAWPGRVINLNCPGLPRAEWSSTVVCPHGLAGFDERYLSSEGPNGRVTWHLTGSWTSDDMTGDDAAALSAGSPTLSLLAPDYNPPRSDPRLTRRLRQLAASAAVARA